MPTEYRLATVKGRYFVVWYDADGRRKRHSLGTDDASLAQYGFAEFKRARLLISQGSKELTVGGIYQAYVDDRSGEQKAAVPRIKDAWKRLSPTFSALAPHHITKELCREYTEQRRKAGAGDGTIHVELGYLRAAIRLAKKENWIRDEPFIPLPKKPEPRSLRLSREEAKRLIKAASYPHIALFIRLALTTASRSAALLDLTWDRVDFERGFIHLHDPQRDRTSKGRATVPMNKSARKALLDARKDSLSPYVIEWGGRRVRSVKKGMAAAAKEAGLKCTPHVLRHSAACFMAEAGVPIAKISQFLGHTNTQVTERVYARMAPSFLKDAGDALELDDEEGE